MSTQASDGQSEDANANGPENEECHDKMLLATNSIGMSTSGRPIFKTSVSDETGVRNGRLQYDVRNLIMLHVKHMLCIKSSPLVSQAVVICPQMMVSQKIPCAQSPVEWCQLFLSANIHNCLHVVVWHHSHVYR